MVRSTLTLSATGKQAVLKLLPPSSDVCRVMPGTPASRLMWGRGVEGVARQGMNTSDDNAWCNTARLQPAEHTNTQGKNAFSNNKVAQHRHRPRHKHSHSYSHNHRLKHDEGAELVH